MTDTVSAPLRWLGGAPPADPFEGCTWGVPLPRGRVSAIGELALVDADDRPLAAQLWPLATWPDGSLKWVGSAIGAGAAPAGARLVTGARPAEAARPIVATEDADAIVVDSGAVRIEVPRAGEKIFRSISRGGTVIAENGRLESLLAGPADDDRPAPRAPFRSRTTRTVLEQSGPVRAVVRVDGVHRAEDGSREWLPFTVRFVLLAGAETVRVVHSFVWDGDAERDFLAGLAIAADVPLRTEPHDRHVRFATAGGGVFAEAVRGVTGLRRDPGADIRAAQIAGRPTPPESEWSPRVTSRLGFVPAWGDFSLSQPTADGFSLRKRTKAGHAWIDAVAGTRAEGLVSLSDPRGGFGIGVRGFWQSHPGRLDVRGADGDTATVTAWLHSPDAAPMDMRFYHDGLGQDGYADQLDALEITYEDYEPGFGDAHGIARTHELTLFAWDATPSAGRLAAHAERLQDPPLLQPTPEWICGAGVFGDVAPIDRSTPLAAEIEDSLDLLLEFYLSQPEQRRWYGFWNYGDVMHAYDFDRHSWRYDVGGYAWDNSELSPDLWLWYSYLRSGRADVFRLAEAMTRHTGEVDVYHAGRFRGLGSRHNVQHWGCSAKQLRISSPIYRRFHHFLTADERTGDLLNELADSDETFLALDPTRKVRTDAATYRPERSALAIGLGTDWGALAATWLSAWERTGDERSRDRLLGTMADIGALPQGFLTGEALYDLDAGRFDTTRDRVSVSHLNAVFGLAEVCSELISLIDMPAFRDAWVRYCRLFLASPEEQARETGAPLEGIHLEQAHSRLAAYAARQTGDPALRDLAWRAFDGVGEWLVHRRELRIDRIEAPDVAAPVDEMPSISTNDAAQYGLAAIQILALLGDELTPREDPAASGS
ncbi:Tat pathway signal sequence domain protein [Microbacterium karelineae]|uniref:exo-rhamnogalacturonan lyase family protein n=1 Tax=Microbacterium karelineae TaxID=2654283 RepID=UPI0012E9CC4B|nr:Tat pathway signal sequence domain protein [Microbacterium karelineae]